MRIHHKAMFTLMRPFLAVAMRRPNLIMIIGCMRSGSSLLSHILTTSPEISGFGESHVRYKSREDLLRLAYWILRFRGQWPSRHRYLLDKVLHDSHIPDVAALASWCNLKVIVLHRDRGANAVSLQRLFKSDLSQAEAYYDERQFEIANLLKRLPSDVEVMNTTYEGITESTEAELSRLRDFLGLQAPLSSEYQLHAASGRWGIGDGSAKLSSGKIVSAASRKGD